MTIFFSREPVLAAKMLMQAFKTQQTVCAIAQSGVCYTGKINSIGCDKNTKERRIIIEDDGQPFTVISRTVHYSHISKMEVVGSILEIDLNVQ